MPVTIGAVAAHFGRDLERSLAKVERIIEDARTADRRDEDGYETERSYPVTDSRAEANGCTLAESPIYLPDGSVQKRFVRVCPDAQGRYQVVD